MTNYFANPPRGCGTKKEGGFYLEGGAVSDTGTLHALTWVLADHYEGAPHNNLCSIPPRRMLSGNPAATLLDGHFVPYGEPWSGEIWGDNESLSDLLTTLKRKGVSNVGLFDHVGRSFYSPWSFAKEVGEYGPSRRVPEQLAREIVSFLPMPIFFTHSDIPMFRDEAHMLEALDLLTDIEPSFQDYPDLATGPTWLQKDWGLYAKQYSGHRHMMAWALGHAAAHRMESPDTDQDRSIQELQELLDDTGTSEAVFCASWVTRVTYVLRQDDPAEMVEQMAKAGITSISLDEEGGDV